MWLGKHAEAWCMAGSQDRRSAYPPSHVWPLRLPVDTWIFNLHVPPFDSKIDEVPELDREFRFLTRPVK